MKAFFIGAAIASLIGITACQNSNYLGSVGRQDVIEGSLPPDPSGPASPDIDCNPASPDC